MTPMEKAVLAGQVALVIFVVACVAGAVGVALFGTGWVRQRAERGRPPQARDTGRPARMRSRWGPSV